ncbi:DBF4-type zinc finger-containing protein 2 isoform X2 [Mastomys coucha]|uniref:DBF4-type zinc finger-containing protein 2 isoform X2 n=1 Tax=Mastomys coucha TaxID=35658 RepID=UPI0012628A0F|nr:DBF4-type zinc finger-containing protein 2 isoform X2 [Mastomys coucha]XP_031223574.1 DBF4-type zinc finger-containing protein 2 isoform X2 [Mastomys coucha]XP_031223575.1 DBF4-type zinc finger-containing protein 2 isoform X2 [Mastomys coucha]XP_031223576.1 DBF4-type zinc finger-containing protein 2 isoform X2 [Mastomys coucha]XP_031223577.1 DBF4-type zinc finger-containing protein 2 isoform X2 [Mastomys coucha]
MEAQSYQEVMKKNGQHLFSSQHRSLTRQSRRRTVTNNTLMERFLQDVLRHHPYNYQDSRSAPNEAAAAAAAADPGSPEVVILDDSDEKEDDTADSSAERNSEDSGSVEEIDYRPGTSQERAEVAVRPSVIQKLERGQQQSLELAHKVESGVKKVNSVGVVQATTSGKKLVRPPVICNAPASSLPSGSFERPVAANSVPRLVLAVASDSFPACDTENLETYFDSPEQGPSNPSSQPKTKDPKKKLNINLDKLLAQRNLRAKGASFSPVVRVRELTGPELCSVRAESSSELEAGTAGNPRETDTLPEQAREGAIPKRREASRSNTVRPQEETHLVLNKPTLLKQKRSVSSEERFDHGSLQAVPGPSQAAVHDLSLLEQEEEEEQEEERQEEEEEEGVDQEDASYESRGSDMSFDCGSSCQSLSALSELTTREIDVSEETHADAQPRNEIPTVSGATSDNGNSSRQVITQNIQLISLVDESYESSGSEVNFDGDDSLPSTSHHPPQPVEVVVPLRLVDKSYGSGSSEPCEDSGSSADETPTTAGQQNPVNNAHANLVDENYGSSSFSSDSDAALDRPQMPVEERSPRDRAVEQENEDQPSSAEAHPEHDGSLEPEADEPQREAEEINLPNQKNTSLGDMNCESHGPEVGFHADDQLEADQSSVNPEEVDLDLENQSVHSGISNLSFDSHASYQSANDQPQGAWGEVNLDELNVEMEVKSNGCSSSELTFDSDSPLLSVTERSLLDFEGLNEDDFNLEDENCVSSSSDITFDSDIPDDSVADQPQVAVYEEEPVGLENKSNESCVSGITFDSDIPLHSGNDHPEVAVKEVIIQEEENVHLEGKNDNPSGSEICLDSNAPLHSVTNSDVAVKKINSPKEEQVHIEHVEQKENEPTDSELNLDCNSFNSKPGCSEDPVVLRVSETRLDSRVPFQSVIRKCEVVVKNVCLQKEKHAELTSKSTESHSEISSASTASRPVTEPYVGKKAKRKTKHLEEVNSDEEYGASQPAFNSDVFPRSMTEKPQPAALKEGHADPKDENTELRGTEVNLNTAGCLDSVISQPQLASNENSVELKDTDGKPSDSKASADAAGHLHSLPKQEFDVITKMNEWKKEAKVLEQKISDLIYSKIIHDSNVSFRSAMDQLELALKQINLGSNDQVSSEDNSQGTCSETNLDSGFSVQAVVEPPEVTVLEPERVEQDGRNNVSCDSEVSGNSNGSVLSEADQHSESGENRSQKDADDTEGKRDDAQGFGITHDSNVPQPLAGQIEVVQEIDHWKDHVNLEDKIVESNNSKINSHSDEPLQAVTNETQEPVQEINLLRGHASPNDDCEPYGATIIPVSNVIFCSVIQKPQRLQKRCASLKVNSSNPCGPEVSVDSHDRPEVSFDSNDPCQSVASHLQKPVKEMNLKEDHIYLDDKSYKLVDFEPTYDSDAPVQFVSVPSVETVSVKEVNLQKENHDDLENENSQPCCSEAAYNSAVHLQSGVDPPQVACKEADLDKKELDIEDKGSVSCVPEVVYDSEVSFQIVVNQVQTSDGETDSPQVVFVDVVSSDSDCDREVISDSNIPLQLEQPQMTVKETSDINTDSLGSAANEKYYCKFCGCDYEASQSVTNQSKESFKIINRKNDYIILGDSTCPSCGHELNFNVDPSDQPTTCQLQEPDRKFTDPEDKNYGPKCPKRKLHWEDTTQPITHQLQKTGEATSLRRDTKNRSKRERSWESSSFAADRAAYAVSVIRQTAGNYYSFNSCGSELNFLDDTSFQSDIAPPQPKKKGQRKKVTFDMRVTKYEYPPNPMYGEVEEVAEGDPKEVVVHEASPQVQAPASVVEKPCPQRREDDVKANTQACQGYFYSYYDGGSETKKILLGEEQKTILPDLNQNATSIQYIKGKVGDTGDFSVALGKPSCSLAEGLHQQHGQVTSQNQVGGVRCATQASSGKKRKITEQEDDSPKRKCFHHDSQKKKKGQTGTTKLPEPQTKVLEPVQPDSLVYIFSSLSMKEDQSLNPPKTKPGSNSDLRYVYSCKEHTFSGPRRKRTVINPPQNIMVPDIGRREIVDIDHNRRDPRSNAEENGAKRQNLASTSFTTMPKRSVLRFHRTSQSSFLKKSEDVGATQVPKDNFQQTLLNRDGAKKFPKSVRKEVFESKNQRKFWKKKMVAADKSCLIKNAYKTMVLRKKSKLASEKLAIWIQLKAIDIIRKYVSRCHGVPPRRHQSKTVLIKMQLRKKKIVARKIKEAKRAAEALALKLSRPSRPPVLPAGAEEQLSTTAGPAELPAHPSSAGGIKRYRKTYFRRRKRLLPVREYDLRSLSSTSNTDRMVTRLASKSKSNEAK